MSENFFLISKKFFLMLFLTFLKSKKAILKSKNQAFGIVYFCNGIFHW